MSSQAPALAVSPFARRFFLANLFAQVGIVITGGLVRLTDSGLGCDTWPKCDSGSGKWTAHEATSYHSYIEFGNRLLTYVLGVIAVMCIVAVYQKGIAGFLRGKPGLAKGLRLQEWAGREHREVRPAVRKLAVAQLLAIFGQAVLGGITVLTDLHPLAVASHLLLSMALIASAAVLYQWGTETDGPVRPVVRREITLFSYATCVVAAALLLVGTIVTGAGPHAGDVKARRFTVDIDQIAWLHADVAFLLLGTALALGLALRVTDAPVDAQRRVWWLLVVLVPQGLIGYTQYFNGIPEWQVLLHMLGACLVTVTVTRIVLGLRTRDSSVSAAVEAAPEPVPAARY